MKADETTRVIEAYASGLQAAGAERSAEDLRSVAIFLSEFGNEELATLIERGSRVPCRTDTITVRKSTPATVAAHLDRLADVLKAGESNADHRNDLASLGVLLRRFGESETLSAVLKKLRAAMKVVPVDTRISGYIDRLRRDMGTAAFDRALAELAASDLKREHVVAIALSVYGGIKKDTSRKAALAFIRKPHDAHVSAKRGIEATGGKSAA